MYVLYYIKTYIIAKIHFVRIILYKKTFSRMIKIKKRLKFEKFLIMQTAPCQGGGLLGISPPPPPRSSQSMGFRGFKAKKFQAISKLIVLNFFFTFLKIKIYNQTFVKKKVLNDEIKV